MRPLHEGGGGGGGIESTTSAIDAAVAAADVLLLLFPSTKYGSYHSSLPYRINVRGASPWRIRVSCTKCAQSEREEEK